MICMPGCLYCKCVRTCGTNGLYFDTRRGASPVALITTTSCALESAGQVRQLTCFKHRRGYHIIICGIGHDTLIYTTFKSMPPIVKSAMFC